jgi:hypothetical protein
VQITTNEPYVRRRGLLGTLGTLLGFVVLGLGMFVSLRQPNQLEITWVTFVPWVTLALGIILLNVGKFYATRYGTRPRVDVAIAQSLKGLDYRSHLYNFVPTVPVDHLLSTPNGLFVLATRPFVGDVIHEGDRWSRPLNFSSLLQRFTDGGLGNPTREAQRDVEAVRNLLRERVGAEAATATPISPIVVLINSRVKLQVTDPVVPVVPVAELRSAIRRPKDGTRLSADLQKQLARALEWNGPSETSVIQPSARSSSWQRTSK